MSSEILGSAIGALLSQLDGLSAAYLPDAVPAQTAEAMVRAANESRQTEPPFSILVQVGPESLDDPACIRLPPASAIRYRQDDRLAIVVGRHPDLASFVQAFREVLSQSYPSSASGPVALDKVAGEALRIVFRVAGVAVPKNWDIAQSGDRLARCLVQLREAHEELRQGPRGWNAYWFEHVSLGLDNLAHALKSSAVATATLSLDTFFETFTYASFGMPTPKDGFQLRPPRALGRAVVDALGNWWGDDESVAITIKQLAHHPDTPPFERHPLADLDWSHFNRALAATDNQLLAFARYTTSSFEDLTRVTSLTESQFFDPLRHEGQVSRLVVSGNGGADLSAGELASAGPFVLTTELVNPASTTTEQVRVRVPLLGIPEDSAVAMSAARITVSGKGVTWTGEWELVDGELWSTGELTRAVTSPEYARPLLSVSLSVQVSAQDPLASVVDSSATCVVHLLPHAGIGLAFMKLNARGVQAAPSYVGPEVAGPIPDDGSVFAATFDDARSRYQVLMWGNDDADGARLGTTPIGRLKSREGVWSTVLVPHGLDEFSLGTSKFDLRTPESKTACHSPIVAAIEKQLISGDRPDTQTESSVRGLLESYFADNFKSADFQQALGHVILPADMDVPLESLTMVDSALLVSNELHAQWSAVTSFKVSSALIHSDAAKAFRESIAALGVAEAMDPSGEGEDLRPEWPSRTSWRHLYDANGSALDDYLNSYGELVRVAQELGDPAGVFWATYPFSASIWNVNNAGRCVAVLLSPLHPLRLAWLASVESTLWEDPFAASLAGTLEGWNFPFFGPRETSNGRLVAIPTDSGEGQVFLGWSMMVEASIDGEAALVAPVRMGNLAAPGSAASGLNATAAAGALRSYRRMNPHVSTLTVDLAASSPTPRLAEVDEAVLAAVQEWTRPNSTQLSGGARIWDSLNRGGESPREAVTKLARASSGAPLTWVRYAPNPLVSRRCNIRMLQDSGIRVEISTSDKENLGVMGAVPLRRFEAHEPPGNSSTASESRPAVSIDSGWPAFEHALGAMELPEKRPRLRSRLFNTSLIDDRADWTVSGESLMSPNAMAALVESDGSNTQMLWEWRPPFLDSSDGVPILERRPFVSIARVPGSFREQVGDMLSKAHGAPATPDNVSSLLGTLGARGVGLSSLVSMGGTHAAGALGFYLAFSLMEAVGANGVDTFVLPIDACDDFLKALAGDSSHSEATRRADLLIIRLSDSELTLTPVEIKFYGFLAKIEHGHLPSPGDPEFDEPLDQLVSTYSLLAKLQSRWSTIVGNGDVASQRLWMNGLTSLVEAGARLRPREQDPSRKLALRMGQLLSGGLPIHIGRPIVSYFRYDAVTADGKKFEVCQAETSSVHAQLGEFGSLAADVSTAFAQAKDNESDLVAAWSELLEWSTAASTRRSMPADDFPAPWPEPSQTKPHELTGDLVPGEVRPNVGVFDLPTGGSAVDQSASRDSHRGPSAEPVEETPDVEQVSESVGVRFPVGQVINSVGRGNADFWPSNTALNQMNVGVVGDLGTGKTQLLKSLIYNLRKGASDTQINPLSLLIFDYKRDFQDQEFLDSVGGVVLRPENIPLNLFSLPNGYTALAAFQKAKAFCDVMGKIYSGVGGVQKDRLMTVITSLFKQHGGKPPTLSRVLADYREGIKGGDSVVGILNTFVLGEVFSDEPDDLQPFESLIQDRVLVVAVSDFGADQDSKNALVALLLNVYYEYMLRSTKWPYTETVPQLRRLNSFLLVDEAVNIMRYEFPALMDIMLQGREFGFGTILASQYLSHFRTSSINYGEPLLTWFIHKVPNVTPKELEQLGVRGLPQSTAGQISELAVHDALYSSLGFPGAFIHGTPFFKILRELRESSGA